jgi:membrane-associated protease RseP (regulator of RpoE activity)
MLPPEINELRISPAGWGIIIFAIYWGIVAFLKRKGILDRLNLTSIGPIILIRTSRGLKLLDKLARWRKFWRIFADLGLPAVFIGMGFMFSLVLFLDYKLLTSPPQPSPYTEPRNVLLIPGINQFIPLLWGIIGLAVTLIVHEFSHGILCRVEGVRVKSLGIILALVPIGGFAEPDERELLDKERTRRMQRVRIFSAGVISNFAVAAVCFAAFFYLLSYVNSAVMVVDSTVPGVEYGDVIVEINGKVVKTENDVYSALSGSNLTVLVKGKEGLKTVHIPNIMGVKILGLYREGGKIYPAEKAGIKGGMVIVRIDNTTIRTVEDFQNKMAETKPGQKISVEVYDNGTFKTFNITLSGKGGKGFLGVYVQTMDWIGGLSLIYGDKVLSELRSVPDKLQSVEGWIYVMAMPFISFQGFIGDMTKLFDAGEFGEPLFWVMNLLYWIAWLNFYVGLFNCLPAIPLDGGRVFHETFTYILSRRYGERAEDISMKVVKVFAFVVFMSIFLSIAIPNLESALKV